MTQSSEQRVPVASIFLLAVAFGLTTGWGEVAFRAIQRFILEAMIGRAREFVWMTPTAAVILFVSVGLLLTLISRLVPRLVSCRVVLFVFTALLFAAPLTSYDRLHWAAGSLFALGAAWRISGALARRAEIANSAARVVAAALTVATLTAFLALSRAPERAIVASPSRDGPNVLLIVWDTVRDKSVDLTGPESETTPVLAGLADTGTTFESAFATSSWTLPSHGSLFTGRYADELDADWEEPLEAGPPTLAEFARDLGYATGGFAANLLYTSWESGLDRGFDHYEDYPLSLRTVLASSWLTRRLAQRFGVLPDDMPFTLRTASDINTAFLEWLDGRPSDRPFFAFLNLADAHKPYTPPEDLYERFAPSHPRAATARFREWTPGEIEAERAAYEAEIALLDRELGVLLDELDWRGARDNTLIIVTSDHGELFGEHELFDHGNALYRPLLQVPLVLALPSTVLEGGRITGPVSIADIPATVAETIAPGTPHPFTGSNLLAHDDRSVSPRPARASIRHHRGLHESIPLYRGDMFAVAEDDWFYILGGDGMEELFSLSSDPDESTNRAEAELATTARLRTLAERER